MHLVFNMLFKERITFHPQFMLSNSHILPQESANSAFDSKIMKLFSLS